ncbi:hypothetical protein GCM10010211_01340 [Streptomyces albospinus]|uniref:Uncharacterized protein n=1 Tax=Streptomyces albospinus TaxID=285515 RepID=A0ABQ2UK96_9ACTN|nr:hypothetical protein [Streptomyces albospinus]GGU41949.1 hypothetical protein GCM10010211_01340 [Streptomyces albospinus]
MSLQDDLTAVERSLDGLVQAVGKLESRIGGGLDIRRVRSDTDHLRESLALLRQGVAAGPPGRPGKAEDEMVPVSDTPYNSALWTDAEDEGLGAKDRHAP